MYVQVLTLFPTMVYEVDQPHRTIMMLDTLRSLEHQVAASSEVWDESLRTAALANIQEQIVALERQLADDKQGTGDG